MKRIYPAPNIAPIAALVGALLCSITLTAVAEPIAMQSERPDGSSIAWSIEHPQKGGKHGLLLIAQGSGCLPAIRNPTVVQAKAVAPNYSVLLVEKYGVSQTDQPEKPMADCSENFFAHHTVSQRVADVQQVVGELKNSEWWNGEMVLFGGSEGGAVVARLAPRLQPDAVVVFSSGLGESLAESLALVIPPEAAREAEAKFAEARNNPDSTEMWGGNSYRWWADIMDVVLVQDLLKSKAPILQVQGARDQFAPVRSARAARDAYRAANRCELTYWEFPGYDHFMTDAEGENHRSEVFKKISAWIEKSVKNGPSACH